MTKQRAAIIKVLRDNCGHFTADEIYFLTKKEYPTVARATIYNNLNSMVDEGIVTRISRPSQPDRFDRNPIPHGHIICTECNEVYDIELSGFVDYVNEKIGCQIESYELIIHAKCPACRSI